MTPTELRERATEAGELYYEILKEIRKGRVEVEVERISRVGRGLLDTYKLKLKNRLFDAESVIFRDVDTEEEFDSEVVQVKEYDPDRRVLVVCLKKKDFTLANKQPNQVVLISDLRFLVTRWVDFMKEHGARLGLPTKLPQLTMPDLPSQATEEQRSAVTQLLEHPFSYVWGAPGTGKTRFVLSQVIVAYLRAGKRVGIFAPTNLSLEQVLTGVMEVTDEAGIDRDVILRLGNPTHSFAEQYPEVCELQGTERLHRGVQRQIKVLEDVQNVVNQAEDEAVINQIRELLPALRAEFAQREALDSNRSQYEADLSEANRTLSRWEKEYEEVQAQRKQAEHRLHGISHKFRKVFHRKKETAEQQTYQNWENQRLALLDRRGEWEGRRDEASSLLKQVERKLRILEQSAIQNAENWCRQSFFDRSLRELLNKINEHNLVEILQGLVAEWDGADEGREISKSLKDEYQDVSPEEIEERLASLRAKERQLVKGDTEERIKQVQVVAATLDTLVGRFPEADLLVDHFFVDEASYASMGKVLPLFVYDKPITFLGDHLQLPPVTELEKKHVEMKGNLPAVIWAESALQVGAFFKEPMEKIAQKLFYSKSTPNPGIPQVDLTQTHRFGASLAQILNEYVYKSTFGSALSDREDTGVYYVQVDKTTRKKQRSNPAEVRAIQHLLPRLRKAGNEDFAIVAPYTKQIDALRRAMPEVYEAERILTVHKSQGREWDYVIFSICDTDDAYFVDSTKPHTHGLNLLNTAVSRTRKGLILVGDIKYWSQQPNQLLSALVRIGKELV